MRENISVVIQGPLDERTYEAIDCYQDFGEVIVSTWSTGENYFLLNKKSKNAKFKLVTSDYPDDMSNIINHGSIYYITKTLLQGSLLAKNEYILKTRSDELYPNLDKMIDNFIKFPNRLHTTDNGFWNIHPFCLSGHLFLDSKKNMIKALKNIIEYCHKENFKELDVEICEQILGYFFMLAREPNEFNQSKWKEFFRRYVYITPCRELPKHLHSGQSSEGRGFKRSREPYPCGRKEVKSGCHDGNKLYQNIKEIV
tara:strand:+ start:384 stop:1148 length:765 start_codon:yes stop_codon:yes gene_type:complete